METVKNFWKSMLDIIVEVQTARAAEHLARCGRYSEVRDIYFNAGSADKTK